MQNLQLNELLRLDHIKKSYKKTTILNDLSLSIKDGEFVTLLGPSGCGKTTLLRIIAGLEHSDSGAVYLSQQDITQTPAEKRQVNTVFQSYALFPHMTILENVMFGLKMHQVPNEQAKQEAVDALTRVHLDKHLHRMPNELSGGQQQRVAIARAVVNHPKILLLDEPLSALDYKLRQTMQMTLKRLQRSLGITFLFVTHDQEEALSMSDRIVVMRDGNIEQIGTPKEIYETPKNMFVAKFIGETNIFQAHVQQATQGDQYQALIEGKSFVIHSDTVLEPKQQVSVLLRPEDIRIKEIDANASSELLTGSVIERTYKGMTLDSMIQMDYGDNILVSEFFDEDDPDTDHRIGQKVEVSWVPSWEVVLTHAQ
jgi:spermidine/putrescine transport system ATP-binding protein